MLKNSLMKSKWHLMLAAAFLVTSAVISSHVSAIEIPATAFSESYTGNGVGTAEAVVRVYDNWTNPPSLLTSVFAAGSDEIADALTTVGGGGVLTSMGINVANANAPSNYTGGTVNVRFYDLVGGAFINGFVANLPVLALAAGQSSRLSFPAGSLTASGIIIPATGAFVSLQHATATFAGAGTLANLGFQTRAPIGVGSSTDSFLNVTTNTSFGFGGNPLANTGIFLDVDVVPEPTSIGLVITGIVALLARRRSQ